MQVIEWFKFVENKIDPTFTVFNIQKFCPPIKKDLLRKAIFSAQKQLVTKLKVMNLIFHTRNQYLIRK